ncbi:T9SS type A sorting domain-containing protein, partial [candidate division WOR-3 bacterium]|nr:T9SS type A sorting domain-containing protein [candidate division WOR-3 bacterium]
LSNYKGWAAGDSGTILHTADGGETWDVQTSGTGLCLRGIYFFDNDKGWTVGDSGTILYTTNGGESWIAQTSGSIVDLKHVFFKNDHLGWVIGNNGKILHTYNGGSRWISQNSGVNKDLNDVYFVDSDYGWVVGDSGIILYTNTGGWEAIDEDTNLSKNFILTQNFPNPFNLQTTIKYNLPDDSRVTLKVYNLLGQEINILVDNFKHSGPYEVTWDGKDNLGRTVPCGVYFIRFTTGEYIATQKLLKVR